MYDIHKNIACDHEEKNKKKTLHYQFPPPDLKAYETLRLSVWSFLRRYIDLWKQWLFQSRWRHFSNTILDDWMFWCSQNNIYNPIVCFLLCCQCCLKSSGGFQYFSRPVGPCSQQCPEVRPQNPVWSSQMIVYLNVRIIVLRWT